MWCEQSFVPYPVYPGIPMDLSRRKPISLRSLSPRRLIGERLLSCVSSLEACY